MPLKSRVDSYKKYSNLFNFVCDLVALRVGVKTIIQLFNIIDVSRVNCDVSVGFLIYLMVTSRDSSKFV